LWPIDRRVARAVLGLDPDARILLQLGRVVPRKGMDVGIRALRHLRTDYGMQAQLLIVGGESERPDPRHTPELGRLSALAVEEGVADRVIFVGRRGRNELKYYYSAGDVFISTPWYEPFGLTPIESMACGTPVIGSRVGGIKYTVRDGETGYLVAPKDPRAVAECLARLFSEPELSRRFARNAVAHAHAEFTWTRVLDQLEDVYRSVAALVLA
jgi:glycosyltransferase involved in cell wall biosynthesis